jgi:hypothetical protein
MALGSYEEPENSKAHHTIAQSAAFRLSLFFIHETLSQLAVTYDDYYVNMIVISSRIKGLTVDYTSPCQTYTSGQNHLFQSNT